MAKMTIEQVKNFIKDVPDFPKPGIVFKDITGLFENPEALKGAIELMAETIMTNVDKIVAIEARGFIFGAALAYRLGKGLVLVRKKGKLPRKTVSCDYQLEYGSDSLEMHQDALQSSDRVIIVDDVLATGGTALAVENLCKKLGAQVVGHRYLIELEFLNGAQRLHSPIVSLLKY